MQEILEDFAKHGYQLSDLIIDGELHRFSIPEAKRKAGYYRVYTNFRADTGEPYHLAAYGDWYSNNKYKFCTLGKVPHSQARLHQAQINSARKAAELARENDYAEAAKEAQEFWERLSEKGNSPYLQRKGLQGAISGIRFQQDHFYVPIRDVEGKFLSLEHISPDGIKMSWSGAKKSGGLFSFQPRNSVTTASSGRIFIAEGFATAASIHLATQDEAICTFGVGNLRAVASALKKKYPDKQFIICGDLDKNERSTSQKLAEEAAKEILCAIAFPNFPSPGPGNSDFNDLHLSQGLEAVKSQLLQACALPVIKLKGSEIVDTPFPDEAENGKRRGTYENVKELIRRLDILIRYNGISKKEEILIPGLETTMDNRANVTLGFITSWCERARIPLRNLNAYITMLADANRYNPVSTWIESEPWDGISRIQELFDTIESSNKKLKEILIRRWLISAIAAAYEPNGVSAHGILVLQGVQYAGKTEWFRKLCPEELRKDGFILRPDDKDSVFQAVQNWLVELGEVDATFSRSDISQFKAFTGKKVDVLRRPYAKLESEYARRTVFCASVNPEKFLNDPTGNRRFWTVPCDVVHQHKINMQQLWAEILTFYRAGESWMLSMDELKELNANNEQFEAIDPIEERLRNKYAWGEKDIVILHMNSTAVCIELGISNPSKTDSNAVARCIRKISGQKPNSHKEYAIPYKKQSTPQPIAVSWNHNTQD